MKKISKLSIVRWGVSLLLLGTAACQTSAAAPKMDFAPVIKTQASQGQVTTVTLEKTSLGVPKSFKVYLPPNYPQGGPYPSLYLLRGSMDEWLNPDQDDSRKGRTAISIYESLRRSGTIGDMILVFPGLTSDDNRWPAIMTDWVKPNDAPGVGNGRFATYFFNDLIPAVDQKFRTRRDRQHRAIDGFSLGGWASIQAAIMHPELFASVGAFDGTYPFAKSAKQVDTSDELWEMDFFDPVFGRPKLWEKIVATSPVNLIQQGAKVRWKDTTWLLTRCPDGTAGSDTARSLPLLKLMAEKGAVNQLEDVIPQAHHNWWFADEHLKKTLKHHWQTIQ